MISKYGIPDGVVLRIQPFSDSNKNASCEIVAEITLFHKDRCIVRIRVINLHWMKPTDVPILMNAMCAITERAQQEKLAMQKRATSASSRKKKKTVKKTTARKKTTKKTKKKT